MHRKKSVQLINKRKSFRFFLLKLHLLLFLEIIKISWGLLFCGAIRYNVIDLVELWRWKAHWLFLFIQRRVLLKCWFENILFKWILIYLNWWAFFILKIEIRKVMLKVLGFLDVDHLIFFNILLILRLIRFINGIWIILSFNIWWFLVLIYFINTFLLRFFDLAIHLIEFFRSVL